MKTDWPVLMDWLCYQAGPCSVRYDSFEFPELSIVFNESDGTWRAALENVHRGGSWQADVDVEPVLSDVLEWASQL